MNVRELINMPLLILASAVGLIGYIFLAQAPVDNPLSLTVAPIVLVCFYLALIPIAILKRSKGKDDTKSN